MQEVEHELERGRVAPMQIIDSDECGPSLCREHGKNGVDDGQVAALICTRGVFLAVGVTADQGFDPRRQRLAHSATPPLRQIVEMSGKQLPGNPKGDVPLKFGNRGASFGDHLELASRERPGDQLQFESERRAYVFEVVREALMFR